MTMTLTYHQLVNYVTLRTLLTYASHAMLAELCL